MDIPIGLMILAPLVLVIVLALSVAMLPKKWGEAVIVITAFVILFAFGNECVRGMVAVVAVIVTMMGVAHRGRIPE